MTEFNLGEIINPENAGLRLQITHLDPLEGVIVKNADPASYLGSFFPVGKHLRFERVSSMQSCWRAVTIDDEPLPWFLLGLFEGRKIFEHYR